MDLRQDLKGLMEKEVAALIELLQVLEKQHKYIVKNDVFNMESVVEEIQSYNQKIASLELKRREIVTTLTEDKTFGKLIEDMNDKELEDCLVKIRKLLHQITLQKDTNELLIKQQLGFTTKMLAILNPDRQAKTYNSYGKIRR